MLIQVVDAQVEVKTNINICHDCVQFNFIMQHLSILHVIHGHIYRYSSGYTDFVQFVK
jgi:hypothetical protein